MGAWIPARRSRNHGWTRSAAGSRPPTMASTAILDVDGTLVDTNYHHAIAWFRAFRRHEVKRCRCGGSTVTSGWEATS